MFCTVCLESGLQLTGWISTINTHRRIHLKRQGWKMMTVTYATRRLGSMTKKPRHSLTQKDPSPRSTLMWFIFFLFSFSCHYDTEEARFPPAVEGTPVEVSTSLDHTSSRFLTTTVWLRLRLLLHVLVDPTALKLSFCLSRADSLFWKHDIVWCFFSFIAVCFKQSQWFYHWEKLLKSSQNSLLGCGGW